MLRNTIHTQSVKLSFLGHQKQVMANKSDIKTERGDCKHNLALFSFFCRFYRKSVQTIGLEALGNYSASFWFNKTLVLLGEGPKPPKPLIPGFVSPGEPLFIGFLYTKVLLEYKNYGNAFKHMIPANLIFRE